MLNLYQILIVNIQSPNLLHNQQISAIIVKELAKRNMQIRCNKDYKSTNPHKRGAISEKNTKNVNEEI